MRERNERPSSGGAEFEFEFELTPFFELSVDMLAIASLVDGRWKRVNPAMSKTLGWSEHELLALPYLELVHPDDLARSREALAVLTTGAALDRFENRVRCKDGSYRWIAWNTASNLSAGLMYCAGRDMTQSRESHAALRVAAERDRFRAALADALRPLSNAAGIQAEATRVLGEHLGAARVHYAEVTDDGMYGFVRADYHQDGVDSVVGRHRLDDYGPTVMNEFRAGRTLVVTDVQQDRRLDAAEKAATAKIGIGSYAVVPLVKDGRPVAMLVVHHARPHAWTPTELEVIADTAQRTWSAVQRAFAEQALRMSEERYRALFEAIDEGFCVMEMLFDASGAAVDYRLLETNPAFARHTGLAGAAGKTARELVPGLEAHWFAMYGRIATTGEPLRFEDESKAMGRWFDVYGFRIGRPDERKVALLFNDITERKRAEEALLEADRRKDEFLATLAHELRNPLASIRNAAAILGMQKMRDPNSNRAVAMIDRQLQQMVRLVDDLLDVSRITTGKLMLHTTRTTLQSVVQQAVEGARSLHEENAHAIQVSVPGAPIHFRCDAARLTQVFSNLLDNACKFTEKTGRIEVEVSAPDAGEVSVTVRDTGVGIASEHLGSVFDMFSQVRSGTDRTQHGLGIGLSLARRLVEMHGGRIEARSAGVGRGSEFIVRLPMERQEDRGDSSPLADGERRAQIGPQRILVVDDNVDAAESLQILLQLGGHDIALAVSGAEALARAEAFAPAITLLDIGMPGMNGYETCRAMRQRPWGRQMVIVALTGWGQEADRRASTEAGFDAHLVKPVNHDALIALLAQLIAERALRCGSETARHGADRLHAPPA